MTVIVCICSEMLVAWLSFKQHLVYEMFKRTRVDQEI